MSVYDNVGDADPDVVGVNPQEELDRILQELYQNISGLDETLEMAATGEGGERNSSPHTHCHSGMYLLYPYFIC